MTQSGSTGWRNMPCRWTSWAVAPAFGLFAGAVFAVWIGAGNTIAVIGGILCTVVAGLLLDRVFCLRFDSKASEAQNVAPQLAAKRQTPVKAEGIGDATQQRPEKLDKARGGQADDLKRINGVGPGLEGSLNELGIFHFDQIAAWRAENVNWIDENLLRFKGRASRDNWVAQAKKLGKRA